MKIVVDKNHLLVIENENIPQTKEYTQNVSGYMFSDFDKGLIVLHKKDWKIVNLKNLGENMNVAYIKNEKYGNTDLDLSALGKALGLFDGFDESTGNKYYFIPAMSDKELEIKKQILEKLNIDCVLEKTDKGVIVFGPLPSPLFQGEGISNISFLFGIFLLYGKFDVKKGALMSVKIQIPLFGQYLKYGEMFDKIIFNLQKDEFFLKSDKLETNNGIIYQISSNDYELLEIFANWYKAVEKFEKITKSDFAQEMKNKLIQFVKDNDQIPSEGKKVVLETLERGMIKLLQK